MRRPGTRRRRPRWRLWVGALVASLALATPAALAMSANASPLGQRIVGGVSATQGELPSAAFIAYVNGSSGFVCTGTVVAPTVVLTAAHCALDVTTRTLNQPSRYVVATGNVDVSNPAAVQVSGVSQVLVNPALQFNAAFSGDAALLVLTRPTSVPAMPLLDPTETGLVRGGTLAAIAGWGDTEGASQSLATTLQVATTMIEDPAACDGVLPAQGLSFDDSTELCAIDSPTFTATACHGDSGGPIVILGPGNRLIQVGITSRGDPSCSTVVPNVFTAVAPLSRWIAGVVTAQAGAGAPAPVSVPPPPAMPAIGSLTPVPMSMVVPPALVAPTGRFRGLTSQREPITLRVHGGALRALKLTYKLRCTGGNRIRATSALVTPGKPVKLTRRNGRWRFSVRYAGSGAHLAVQGDFQSGTNASGTLTANRANRRGVTVCRSGAVAWTASA